MERMAKGHVETVMYIDRSFQAECERIAADRDVRIAGIESAERAALEKMRGYVEVELARIDAGYAKMVQDQEILFKKYGDFCQSVSGERDRLLRVIEGMSDTLRTDIATCSVESATILGQTIVGMTNAIVNSHMDQFVRLQSTMAEAGMLGGLR